MLAKVQNRKIGPSNQADMDVFIKRFKRKSVTEQLDTH